PQGPAGHRDPPAPAGRMNMGLVTDSGAERETYCIFGYDRTVKPNLNLVLDRVPAEDRALVQQIIDRATRDGADLDFGHRLLMPDGVVKHVNVVARATKAESGGIEFVGAVIDVTEQKRAEVLVAGEKKLLE